MARIGHVPKSQLYSGPGYNLFDPPVARRQFEEETSFLNPTAMRNAAESVRAAEVDASVSGDGVSGNINAQDIEADEVDPDDTQLDSTCLYRMSIDELRIVAGLVAVPNRAQITDRNELIAAIERAQ